MGEADTSELKEADLGRIKRMIPHRYPFLLIDHVKDIVVGDCAVGIKNVTVNEPHFQGHFPDKPVMPGVLIVEAMAQTAGVLVVETLEMIDQGLLVYFMTLDKTRFRKIVAPGDVLELHVKILRGRGKIWKFWGEAKVGGDVAAEAEFSAIAHDVGCELLHVEFKGGSLRVFLDRPEADGGVTIDDCQAVSRQISALLDVHDFGKKRYTLEVSSPGLDRELYNPRDYHRFTGHLVRVTFFEEGDDGRRGKRTIVGRLEGLATATAESANGNGEVSETGEALDAESADSSAESSGSITVAEGDRSWTIPLSEIKVARLEIEL